MAILYKYRQGACPGQWHALCKRSQQQEIWNETSLDIWLCPVLETLVVRIYSAQGGALLGGMAFRKLLSSGGYACH